MKPQARFDAVKSHKLCFLCLLPGHSSSVYQRTYICSVPNCGKKHSEFIHVDTLESRSDVTPTGSNDKCPSVPSDSNASANIDDNKSHVYLPIVPVTCNGGSHIFHALLDSGSTNSFVSESLAKCLQLSTRETNYNVNTLASNTQVNKFVSLQLGPLDGAQPVKLNALVVPDIPARHPVIQINTNHYPHLHDLPILHCNGPDKSDILIGMDHAHLLVSYEVRSNPSGKNEPYATRTFFGWSLSGPLPGQSNQVYSNFVQGDIEQDFENMWKVETGECTDLENLMSPNDQKVLD